MNNLNFRKLYIGNIPSQYTEADVLKDFSIFGRIEQTEFKGRFCFVEYSNSASVLEALAASDEIVRYGERLIVKAYRPMPSRGGLQYDYGQHGYDRGVGQSKRTSFRVAVLGLDERTSWQDLKDFGRQVGEVNYADVVRGPGDERRGILEFFDEASMKQAIRQLSKQTLFGAKVQVVPARLGSGGTGSVSGEEPVEADEWSHRNALGMKSGERGRLNMGSRISWDRGQMTGYRGEAWRDRRHSGVRKLREQHPGGGTYSSKVGGPMGSFYSGEVPDSVGHSSVPMRFPHSAQRNVNRHSFDTTVEHPSFQQQSFQPSPSSLPQHSFRQQSFQSPCDAHKIMPSERCVSMRRHDMYNRAEGGVHRVEPYYSDHNINMSSTKRRSRSYRGARNYSRVGECRETSHEQPYDTRLKHYWRSPEVLRSRAMGGEKRNRFGVAEPRREGPRNPSGRVDNYYDAMVCDPEYGRSGRHLPYCAPPSRRSRSVYCERKGGGVPPNPTPLESAPHTMPPGHSVDPRYYDPVPVMDIPSVPRASRGTYSYRHPRNDLCMVSSQKH